jgi:hypothetical protein
VRTISCSKHVETIFHLAARAHKHNFCHRCNHFYYAMSHFGHM